MDESFAALDVSAAPTAVCRECAGSLGRESYSQRQWRAPRGSAVCRKCSVRANTDVSELAALASGAEKQRAATGVKLHPRNHGYSNYVDQLFGLACFEDVARLRLFPSAKDVSESFAVLHAAATEAGVPWRGPGRVLALAVGDGTTPRTGALAAYLTDWHCVSIDPVLGDDWVGIEPKGVRRLRGAKQTLEAFAASDLPEARETVDRVLLLCVHSHARFVGGCSVEAMQRKFKGCPVNLVALPCCSTFHPDRDVCRKPNSQYDDACVFSAKRRIKVWNFEASAATPDAATPEWKFQPA
ncbi:hypothetical protein M885DRAFT_476344 [Pelagophyceae sp. CCMP2097]|nr:hypothetical protein M885DRAFT_476344 [Pelagophyceae sp. CCMP2097]